MSMNAENAGRELRSCSETMRITGKRIARNAEAIGLKKSYPLFLPVRIAFRRPVQANPADHFTRGPGASWEMKKKGSSFMGCGSVHGGYPAGGRQSLDPSREQPSEFIKEERIASLKEKRKKEIDSVNRYRDLLEMAQLVSWCTDRDYLIRRCLEHINRRLGMRARCALMEKGELKIQWWVGRYDFPIRSVSVCKESVVWKAVKNGEPVNLTEWPESEGYRHTLLEEVKIKSIIPLWNVDSLSQEEKIVGALIVDSGKEGNPVSAEDFAYLKEVGQLIGAAVGKADLMTQLVECHRGKEAMVMETLDAFRNRIAAIGVISRRIKRMAADHTGLAQEALHLTREVKLLEDHLQRFEKYTEK
jgi:hypothetical protein